MCSQTASFGIDMCLLAVVPKVYPHIITRLIAILSGVT